MLLLLVAGWWGQGCSLETCAPLDEPDAPEGNSLVIILQDYEFSAGTWTIDIDGDGVDVECEVELGQESQQRTCSDGAVVTADGEQIFNVFLRGSTPRQVSVGLSRDGMLEASEQFSPAYDDMGHCSTSVHAVVEFEGD